MNIIFHYQHIVKYFLLNYSTMFYRVICNLKFKRFLFGNIRVTVYIRYIVLQISLIYVLFHMHHFKNMINLHLPMSDGDRFSLILTNVNCYNCYRPNVSRSSVVLNVCNVHRCWRDTFRRPVEVSAHYSSIV